MQEPSALGRAVLLVRELRKRCPWDAAQTPQTLRPYLVEEVLELDAALSEHDPGRIRDELGDLLLHLAFQIVLGEEAGAFGAEDVTRATEEKMWRRHPHLFPGDRTGPAAEHAKPVNRHGSWERTKLAEPGRDAAGVLDGLPPNLPVMIMAYRLQERAAGVGFDWPDAAGPLAKVREELAEVEDARHAASPAQPTMAEQPSGPASAGVEHEIGDLLFAVINLARKLGCDPRAALEQANRRFSERFRYMERLAAGRGLLVGYATLEQLDDLWDEAKRAGVE